MAAQAEAINLRVDPKQRERIFYPGMAIAILITVFAGFSRTWFLRPYFPQVQGLIPLLVLHGVLFSSWIALFITQTSLIAARRTRTHMRLGIAGGVLAFGTVSAIKLGFASSGAFVGPWLPATGSALLAYEVFWPRGNEVHVPPETCARIRLSYPLTVRVPW